MHKGAKKECKHKGEFYTCKRMRLLEYLIKAGFEPCQTLPDPDNPRYNVWKFKNTPDLENTLDVYFSQFK